MKLICGCAQLLDYNCCWLFISAYMFISACYSLALLSSVLSLISVRDQNRPAQGNLPAAAVRHPRRIRRSRQGSWG